MRIERIYVHEAVKHPWRGDPTKVIDGVASTMSQAYDGWMGEVVFTETTAGIEMAGYRRRAAQPEDKMEPRFAVFVPWWNIKWAERGPAPDRDERGAAPAREEPKKRERPLGAGA